MQMGPSGSSKTTLLGEHHAGARLPEWGVLIMLFLPMHISMMPNNCNARQGASVQLTWECMWCRCAGRQEDSRYNQRQGGIRRPGRLAWLPAPLHWICRAEWCARTILLSGHITNTGLHLGSLRIIRCHFSLKSQSSRAHVILHDLGQSTSASHLLAASAAEVTPRNATDSAQACTDKSLGTQSS